MFEPIRVLTYVFRTNALIGKYFEAMCHMLPTGSTIVNNKITNNTNPFGKILCLCGV